MVEPVTFNHRIIRGIYVRILSLRSQLDQAAICAEAELRMSRPGVWTDHRRGRSVSHDSNLLGRPKGHASHRGALRDRDQISISGSAENSCIVGLKRSSSKNSVGTGPFGSE